MWNVLLRKLRDGLRESERFVVDDWITVAITGDLVTESAGSVMIAKSAKSAPEICREIGEIGAAAALNLLETMRLRHLFPDSLEGEDEATIGKAWADEIRRRKNALRSGATQAVPWPEARARLGAL